LIAAAVVIAVISLGLWLLPLHTSDKPRTGPSTPTATLQDSPAAVPPPAAEESAPPPPVKAPPPTWRGCYPLQPNC
jgi:hypothetical protein